METRLTCALVCLTICGGFDFSLGDVRDATDGDQLLACRHTERSANGSLVFSLAVTIRHRAPTVASHTPGLQNWFGWLEAPSVTDARYSGAHRQLSAHIELLSAVYSGRGLLAFTTRAQPENLCQLQGKANFGPNLISKHFDDRQGAREYDNLLLGHVMGWGYGADYSMGMGGFVNNYGWLDNDGVVAEVPLIAGTMSTLDLDNIPFKHMAELAGRGVLASKKMKTRSRTFSRF